MNHDEDDNLAIPNSSSRPPLVLAAVAGLAFILLTGKTVNTVFLGRP
jgi:hypothetical protein